jgi:hypothetical protein
MKKPFNKKILLIPLGIFLTIALAIPLTVEIITYRPLDTAKQSLIQSEEYQQFIHFPSQSSTTGIIFYPGGFVDPKSYAYFAALLQASDLHVFIVKPLLYLAITQPLIADTIINDFSQISNWIVGGHSLGGSTAAIYAHQRPSIQGLFFLAAYTTESTSFTDTSLPILSILGSEDTVLNLETYQTNKIYLNSTMIEHTIIGGNHSYFGDYGLQRGDGQPLISMENQHLLTVQLVTDWLNG